MAYTALYRKFRPSNFDEVVGQEAITKTIDDDNHWYGVKFEKALPVLVRELNK